MTTQLKAPKTELIAIYRLEFYKKKKNWKFCQDVCKKDEPVAEIQSERVPEIEPEVKSPTKKTVLNKTYNVIIEPEEDDGAPALNNAFLETEPDKILPETPPDPKADKSWPDRCKTSPPGQNIQQDVCWEPDKPWPEWVPDNAWQLPGETDQIWQNVPVQQDYIPSQEFYSGQNYYANYEGWPGQDVWTQNAGDADGPDGDVCDGAWYPDVILQEADKWLQADHSQGTASNTEDTYSASLESFMLGAAAAPHSSELDLRARSAGSEPESGVVVGMSPQQLAADVARHAHALRCLLHEARARDQLPSSHSEHYEEPTRDPGPSLPPPISRPFHNYALKRQDTFVKDPFVAGSFKAAVDLPGKGRGRLRSRPGVIGIGMGRPYRL